MIAHLVTDSRRLSRAVGIDAARRCLLQQTRFAVDAGVDVIQIRERDLDGGTLADLVESIVRLTRPSRTRVVVNDRLDVALASGADGVHLRADSFSPTSARRMMPDGFIVGRSVHSVAEAVAATDADYLVAGTIWPTESKPGQTCVLGLERFTSIVKAVRIPVLAIGGVTVERIPEIARAGGAGIAAIGLFMDMSSPAECRAVPLIETIAVMRQRFDTSRTRS